MKKEIPMADPKRQYRALKTELDTAVSNVLKGGQYILGEEVANFEANLASYLGLQAENIMTCGNGTDALRITYGAIGLEAGDEVIMPSFNYVASAESALQLGLVPVWADINGLTNGKQTSQTFNISCDSDYLKSLLTPKTKALVGVNLYGNPLEANKLKAFCYEHNLILIEDNAQGLGSQIAPPPPLRGTPSKGGMEDRAKYSTTKTKEISPLEGGAGECLTGEVSEQSLLLGDITTTSFFPTKSLGCFGDGGAVFSTNKEWIVKARSIARHGQGKKYDYQRRGINSRLDTIQAGILEVKLKHLDDFVGQTRAIAQRYMEALQNSKLILPSVSLIDTSTFHQFTLLLDESLEREAVRNELIKRGIASALYYPEPLHLNKFYKEQGIQRGNLDNSEKLSRQMLSLPIYPYLREDEQDYIITQLLDIIA